jgi:nicotinamidase-related amidase
MPLTTFDRNAALIVIDLQKGIAGLPVVHPAAGIIDRSAQLARAFRQHGLPVVLVNVTAIAPGRTETVRPKFAFPPDWTDLVPELDQQPSDLLISKQRVGAFIGTGLQDLLSQRGVTQVFLTGIATSAGVQATGWSAYDYGYNVVFVTDAMTDRELATHTHCVEKVFPRIGETDTSENVLSRLRG